MLNHNQIMKLCVIKFDDGEVVNVDTENKTGEVVFVEDSVNPEFLNLLQSSAMLYQTLSYQKEQLEALIECCEETGAVALISKFEEMLGAVEFVLSISENGMSAHIKEAQ